MPLNDSELLDSLANYLYRLQWDSDNNCESLNKVLDELITDPGYNPGIAFRRLLEKHLGDKRPKIILNGGEGGRESEEKAGTRPTQAG